MEVHGNAGVTVIDTASDLSSLVRRQMVLQYIVFIPVILKAKEVIQGTLFNQQWRATTLVILKCNTMTSCRGVFIILPLSYM
jgi:hypothetical protein